MLVSSTLSSGRVQAVLAQLRDAGEVEDESAKARLRARESELGSKIYGPERAQMGASAPLSVAPEVGRLLYALTLAARPSQVVEFGASLGCSTIYLASALRDLGAGSIITTELLHEKAQRASTNVGRAGFGDLVEIREGDAVDSLAYLEADVDLLFLDGSNDLYLKVLKVVEPRLCAHALVIADMSRDEPYHAEYRAYVNNPAHGYLTTEIPMDAGLVISARTPVLRT